MITRPKRQRLSINKMIPNILTLMALSAGMSAIRFAYELQWEYAAMAIGVAAILDGLDGRIARLLKGTSKFGAELDSLSDFVCFGVAPAVVLYFWSAHTIPKFGWLISLLYTMSCALRLARFNTASEEPNPPAWTAHFFSGVPSPAAAGLVMVPMILSFQLEEWAFLRDPILVSAFLIGVAALMVSRMPTFSFKKAKLSPGLILPMMLVAALLASSIVSAPWLTLSLVLLAYLISMPFSWRMEKNMRAGQADSDTEARAMVPELMEDDID